MHARPRPRRVLGASEMACDTNGQRIDIDMECEQVYLDWGYCTGSGNTERAVSCCFPGLIPGVSGVGVGVCALVPSKCGCHTLKIK